MKFVFIAKHRNIWPVAWLCEAMGVSRSGFHAWLNRTPSARSRSDEAVSLQVKASFLASDRTYGARRVWKDLAAEGVSSGHKPDAQRLMTDNGVVCSMSRSGNVWDNAAMESFFSSLKTERTAHKLYRTRDEARADVFDYIERFYNPKRRHSTIGYLSPMEFEQKAGLA